MSVDAALRECALVFEQRGKEYGPVEESFSRAAHFATGLCGREIAPSDVVRVLMAVKLARLSHQQNHDDSMVDLSVYAQILRVVMKSEASNV